MYINAADVESIREFVKTLDTDERRERYRIGDFPRADAVKDLNRRYRWDLWYGITGNREWFSDFWDRYPDIKDAHIETVLRKVVPDL